MDKDTMLAEAFARTIALEAQVAALKAVVLTTDASKKAYKERYKEEIKRLQNQFPHLLSVLEQAILELSD